MNPDRQLIEEALPGYEIGVELGRGAWGVVLSGRHKRLGRKVAIKQLPRAFAADPEVSERFLREAQMAASLDHPHIVPVYDYVEQDGLAVIVMEQCPGTVADKFRTEGIHTDEACAAALATCSALSYAHGRGVLHRDIKPENLLIDEDGTVKLGDFGIARALDAATRLTATGMVVGTPAYMSPEQAGGEDLLATSDVYSLGVVLYELLSGDLPFDAVDSWGALLRQHMFEPPKPLLEAAPDTPARIAAVVDHALAKAPADRWPSANEFGVALAEATSHAFGAGWLRQRRFALLSAPDIIAATERNVGGDGRGGTMIVRGHDRSAPTTDDTSTPQPTDTDARATQLSTPPPVDPLATTPPAPPTPAPAAPGQSPGQDLPPPTPPSPAPAPVGAVVPPVSPPGPAGAPSAPPPAPSEPPATPEASAFRSGNDSTFAWRVVAIAGVVVIVVVAVVIFAVSSLTGGDDDTADATDDGDAAQGLLDEGDTEDPGADDGAGAEEPAPGGSTEDDGAPDATSSDDGAGTTGDDPAEDPAADTGDEGAPPAVGSATGAGLVIGSLLDSDEFARDEDKQVTMDLAAEDINEAGGVLGQPVTYLERPYDGEAELVLAADDLAREGASAIVGPTDPVDTNDVLATVTGAGIVLISPTDFFSRPDETGLYFQTRMPATLFGPAAVSLIPDGVSRVTIIGRADLGSTDQSVRDALVASLAAGGYVASEIDIVDDDVVTAASQIGPTSPDMIMIHGVIGLTEIYGAMIDAGFGPTEILVLAVGRDGGASDMDGGRITGARGITRDALTGNNLEPRIPASDLSSDASQAYDAVIIAALAAEQAGSTDPVAIAEHIPLVTAGGQQCNDFAECRDLIAAGTDIDYVGPGGTYEISPETGRPTAGTFRVSTIGDSGFSLGTSEPYLFRLNG